jgi:hypothetical protein
MYCTNCGQPRPDSAAVCTNCGHRVARYNTAPQIPNYLVQSILVTLCCCVPVGVVAIVYSAQVNTKLAAGDVAGARDASQKAKMWAWIGFGIGALVGAIYLGLGLLSGFSGS